MTYDHLIQVTRETQATTGTTPNSGWGAVVAGPTTMNVYAGPADVQDGSRTLKAIQASLGDTVDANARVYLPPTAAQAFAGIDIGDQITTPLGSGTVVSTSHSDGALTVRISRETDAVPTLIN